MNQLTGAIPPDLGGLDQLTVLILSMNQLSGQIPASLERVEVSLESFSLIHMTLVESHTD